MISFYTNKKDIINWLEKYGVKNYTLISDNKYGFVVDVGCDVTIKSSGNIPIKFNEINGFLSCRNCDLESLDFAPKIINGSFDCTHNKLTSLESSPEIIRGSFNCYGNEIKSLKGCTKEVSHFDCSNNELISLEFIPEKIGGYLNISNNFITSLKYCPEIIYGNFNCSKNNLGSLEYCPEIVKGLFVCGGNKIQSLLFCPKEVSMEFYCNQNNDLGEIQKITDFKQIYIEHRKLLMDALEDRLTNIKNYENLKKLGKIKI